MIRFLFLLIPVFFFAACNSTEELSDAYGNFEATSTLISAEAGGKLLFLNVEEGRTLEAGSLVALVDTTALHLERKRIQASIGALPKKLQNSLQEIEVLEQKMNNLVRERDRTQRLVDKKAALPKQLDDLNGEIEVVRQQMDAVKASTQTFNSSVLAEKGPLLAQVRILDDKIRRSYIINPIRGTVLTKMAEAHELVMQGSPLYRIAPLDTLTLRVYAQSKTLQNVRIGQPAEVWIDQGSDQLRQLSGTVIWISDQAEFTPTNIQTREDRVNLVYAVKLAVPNPEGVLKIGMPAEVNFPKTNSSAQIQ